MNILSDCKVISEVCKKTGLSMLIELWVGGISGLCHYVTYYIREVYNCSYTFLPDVEHMEDDSKSGRPSTSRTEANIEHRMQVVYGDH